MLCILHLNLILLFSIPSHLSSLMKPIKDILVFSNLFFLINQRLNYFN